MSQLTGSSRPRCLVKHDLASSRHVLVKTCQFACFSVRARSRTAVGASGGEGQSNSTAVTQNTQQAAHKEVSADLILQPHDQTTYTGSYSNGHSQPAPFTISISAYAPNPVDKVSQHEHQQQQLQQLQQQHEKCQQQKSASSRPGPASKLLVNPLRLVFGKAWRKAVPLSILFFTSTFIFTLLQSLKDGIVVMNMGADALPFLATFGTLPASLAFFSFYKSVLVPRVTPQHLFSATAAPLLAFYALFALVLFPLAPSLQNPTWLAFLPEVLPQGLRGLAAMLQYWVYSLFFVAGDLWGPVMISLAFWTVADEVCTMEEAGQLYPQLGLLANLGLVGSGRVIRAVHDAVGGQGGADGMGAVLQVLVGCMLATAAVMFVCKMEINKRHLNIGQHGRQQHHQQLKLVKHRQHDEQQQQQHAQQQHQRQQAGRLLQQLMQPVQQQQQLDVAHCCSSQNGHQAPQKTAPAASKATSSTSSSSSSSSSKQRMNGVDRQSSYSKENPHHHQQRQQQECRHQCAASISRPGSSVSPAAPVQHQKSSWSEVVSILQHNTTAAALATTVVGFSISYRMYEYSYKAQLQLASADSVAYCCKLAEVQSAVGMATIGMMLASRFIFKHLGWSAAAMISPYSMLLSGTAFFACSLFAQAAAAATPPAAAAVSSSSIAAQAAASASVPEAAAQLLQRSAQWLSDFGHSAMHGQDLVWLGLAAGFATALASCACHNSLFTPCKQMVYKTLPAHQVDESKAAVDLVGGQFAKSAAGWLVQLLLLSFGNITAALPACFVIFVASILAWLRATFHLSKQMEEHATKLAQQTESTSQQEVSSVQQQQQQQQRLPQVAARDLQQRPSAAMEELVNQQQQQQQKQWHVALDWQLPLPRQLAVAAAGTEQWPQHVLQPAAANLGLAAEAAGTHSMLADKSASSKMPSVGCSSSSSKREFATVQAAQHMYTDAGYWDRVYAALAGNPRLLESVLAGHSIEASSGRLRDEHWDDEQQQQQHVPSSHKPGRDVRKEKQALHTIFDIHTL